MKSLSRSLERYSHVIAPSTDKQEEVVYEIPFIPLPRYLIEHLEQGRISYREYEVYLWMRAHANLYGIASVNVPSIISNLTHLKSADYVTKIIRTLRNKKYIYYQDRKGHRGSFEVRFDYWLGKKGIIYTFDSAQSGKYIRGSATGADATNSEVPPDLTSESPRLGIDLEPGNKGDITKWRPPFVRGGNNDIEKDKKKETNDLSNSINEATKQLKVTTFDFKPKTYEEQRCREIAMEIGDSYINFTLSILRDKQGGIDLLEEALSAFKEAKGAYSVKGTTIKNSGALFNKIVKGLKQRNKYSKYG